jgi:hypothetical protein
MRKKSASKTQELVTSTRWDAQWKKQLSYLVKFQERHGRWPKASEDFPKDNRLGQWSNRQRDLRDRGLLDGDRVKALRDAGFHWDKPDARAMHWNDQFRYLIEFRKKNSDSWPYARQEFPKGNRLGLWVWRQRQAFAAHKLPKRRRESLEKIHFPFELPDSWETHYLTLKQYRAKHPNRWPKAREEFPTGNRLGLWCHLQRCAYKADKLLPERASKLDKVGFQWSVKQVSWMRFFELLKEYKRLNPKKWPVLEASALKDRRLIAWCSTQRHKRKIGKLEKSQIAALDGLGFRW